MPKFGCNFHQKRAPLSKHHHMTIRWDEFIGDAGDELAIDASLKERAAIVGRIGILMLACGTGTKALQARAAAKPKTGGLYKPDLARI